jgi:predicted metal-dependent hydrolase
VDSLLRRLIAPRPTSVGRDASGSDRVTLDVALPDGRIVPVLRVRDARARRIKLLVSERGARLTVPPRASLREAERFLAGHLDWLALQLERRAPPPARPLLDFESSATLPLRGAALPVTWREGRSLRVDRDADGMTITRSPQARAASLRLAVKEFYLGEARRDVGRWLPRYLPELPRPPRLVRLRPLRSLWGSLSPDDALSLDLALVLGPPAAFEYVLVHELCHLIRADHSRAFWREVERRCPDWRAHRAWFRGEGLAMKDELRTLIAAKD